VDKKGKITQSVKLQADHLSIRLHGCHNYSVVLITCANHHPHCPATVIAAATMSLSYCCHSTFMPATTVIEFSISLP
jgi:hypothetical protein